MGARASRESFQNNQKFYALPSKKNVKSKAQKENKDLLQKLLTPFEKTQEQRQAFLCGACGNVFRFWIVCHYCQEVRYCSFECRLQDALVHSKRCLKTNVDIEIQEALNVYGVNTQRELKSTPKQIQMYVRAKKEHKGNISKFLKKWATFQKKDLNGLQEIWSCKICDHSITFALPTAPAFKKVSNFNFIEHLETHFVANQKQREIQAKRTALFEICGVQLFQIKNDVFHRLPLNQFVGFVGGRYFLEPLGSSLFDSSRSLPCRLVMRCSLHPRIFWFLGHCQRDSRIAKPVGVVFSDVYFGFKECGLVFLHEKEKRFSSTCNQVMDLRTRLFFVSQLIFCLQTAHACGLYHQELCLHSFSFHKSQNRLKIHDWRVFLTEEASVNENRWNKLELVPNQESLKDHTLSPFARDSVACARIGICILTQGGTDIEFLRSNLLLWQLVQLLRKGCCLLSQRGSKSISFEFCSLANLREKWVEILKDAACQACLQGVVVAKNQKETKPFKTRKVALQQKGKRQTERKKTQKQTFAQTATNQTLVALAFSKTWDDYSPETMENVLKMCLETDVRD